MFNEFFDNEAIRCCCVAFVFKFEEFGERIGILNFLIGFAVKLFLAFK